MARMITRTGLIVSLFFISGLCWGQLMGPHNMPSMPGNPEYELAYYQQMDLYTSDLDGRATDVGRELRFTKRHLKNANNRFTYSSMPPEILAAMPITQGMGFYSALRSPYDPNTWLFVERELNSDAYNLCLFQVDTRSKQLVFSQSNCPSLGYAFNPIAWTSSESKVLLERIVFGSATENEGVWSYDLRNGQSEQLHLSPNYLSTPVISPDAKFLVYCGTTEPLKGLHSQSDQILLYDLTTDQERILKQNVQAWFSVVGWVDVDVPSTEMINLYDVDPTEEVTNAERAQPSFKLPWPSGSSYCVRRTGSGAGLFTFPSSCPAPTCGPHTGDHEYQAIDFGLPLGTNVLAAAGGTVVYAWFNANGIITPGGGYGNLVKIRHSDNTYTYYAHLNQIAVKVGDVVSQGCILGKSGNTGHSTGEHLHFERRDSSGARFITNADWPVFAEYGCTPNQNKQYTSQNSMQTCTSSFSLNCANATPISCGQSISGKTEGHLSTLNDEPVGDYSVVASNPYNGWNDPGPEDLYVISVSAGSTFTASLSNMASGLDLDVFILNGCSVTNNSGNVTVSSTSSTITNAAAGTYYILVDGSQSEYPSGSGEYGNYGAYTLTVTGCTGGGSQPDLEVTSGTQYATPTSAAPGQNVTAGCSVANNGPGSAGSSQVTLWLSNDDVLNTSTDTYIGQFSTPPLAPSSSSAMNSASVQIPANTCPGNYYLFFWADGNQVVIESVEDNNVASVQLTVTGSLSTAPSSASATPSTITVGQSTTLTRNGGSLGTGAQWLWHSGSCDGPLVGTGSSISISPTSTTIYYVRAEGPCGSTSCTSVTVTVNGGGTTPVNDDCPGTTLTSSTSCSYLSNQTVNNATASGLAKGTCDTFGAPDLADVWYSFVAQATSHTITVDPNGSALDAVIAAYSSCGGGQIGCSDTDGGNGTLSTLVLNGLTVGATYLVRVYDYGLQTTNGGFRICVTHTNGTSPCTSCPSYDFAITPTTTWQTSSSSHGAGGCKMYRVAVTSGNTYEFQTGCGNGATANYDTYLELYNNGCSLVDEDDDGCDPNPAHTSHLSWTANYSGYAYLKVRGYNSNSGSYTLAYRYQGSSPSYCNGLTTLTDCSGTFSDGSGANDYSNNSDCAWLIQPTCADAILLEFTSFDTENGFDYVSVYNGTSAGAPLIGVYDGSNIPSQIASSGGALYVHFTSDGSFTESGWSATYSCFSYTTDCEGTPCGTALPGTACDDGNSGTTNDTWSAGCACTGTPICIPPAITGTTSNSPLCSTSSLNLGVTASGTGPLSYAWTGTGTFSPNASSQNVTVTGAASGNYQVVVTNACGTASSSVPVVVNTAPSATISYSGSPYCTSGSTANVTRTGSTGGTYSASPTGLSISASTGAITLGSSTAGTYTVTYSIAASGGCAAFSTTASVVIGTAPSATITYSGSPFCTSSGTATVTRTGSTGGTYSATPSGLSINASTGAIALGNSTAGTYTVTYSIAASGGCSAFSTTASVVIGTAPSATISYSGSPFCTSSGTANVTRTGSTGGTYSAAPTGLSINSSTGAITLGSSSAGTYTVTYSIAASGGCSAFSTTTSVVIGTAPSAAISYSGSPYCTSGGTANVTRTGSTGGTYSATPSGLSISSSTGAITLGTSTAGTYTVTYSIAASGGCLAFSTTASVVIGAAPSATISYSGTPYCTSGSTASVTRTGSAGGTYSATPSGLSINASTGAITLGNSTAGTYTVTYSIAASGGCAAFSTTASVVIGTVPSATISYSGSPFCTSGGTANVTRTGSTGGTYSATPAGLTISASTGAITLVTSSAGTYTVTYSIAASGGCAAFSTTASVVIGTAPSATISYSGSPYCTSGSTATVTRTGSSGGTYSASPSGLSINASTGAITLGSSSAGNYTVTYSIAASGGCSAFSTTASVVIGTAPLATISYSGSPFCTSSGTATVTRTGSTGGTYSATPAGLSINASTGAITLGTSTAGTYTVTYSIAATGGCAAFSTTAAVVVNAAPTATISYTGTPYCTSGGTAAVTRTGNPGGTYSATPAGLVIDPNSGMVDLGTSVAASYTVTYSIPASGGCSMFSTTAGIEIGQATAAAIAYLGSPYCASGTTATVSLIGIGGGSFTANPAGLAINAGSGTVDLGASAIGNYTVTYSIAPNEGCAAYSTTAQISIGAAPSASIVYGGTPFCASLGQADVTRTGSSGGVFSGTPAGLVIDAATGSINLSASTAGNYTVTYAIAASGGCSAFSTTTPVSIGAAPSATISYNGSPYCTSGGSATVSRSGTPGGSFSATPTGLSINSLSGTIDLGNSTAGTYTVTYAIAAGGGCTAFSTAAEVVIDQAPSAGISYGGSPYCTDGGTATVSISGPSGGSFSAVPSGLSINAGTGAIALASSTAGTYTVTYIIAAAGGCAAFTTTASLVVGAAPSATIEYSGSPYCSGGGTVNVTRTGTAGGTYAAVPGGLSLNAGNGSITIVTSTPGSYTVTYSVAATGGCAAFSTTAPLVIGTAPSATIEYPGTPFCTTEGPANVSRSGSGSGSYGSDPAGLSLNASTGTIDPGASAAGSYTVTYSIAASGGCSAFSTTAQVDIETASTWYSDVDGDGAGDPDVLLLACEQPSGYVAIAGDACPADPNKTDPGACGCGVPDTDTDLDGVPDCIDSCPLLAGAIGDACDDGNANTANDVITANCECIGQVLDCLGVPGGTATIGSACDDADPSTVGDVYGSDCVCAGQLTDCEGTPGGTATIGTSCDDGDASTGNDVYGSDCVCAGQLIDCEGTIGGTMLPGSSCDDGDATTGNDVYGSDCVCAGELIDCEGTIGGTMLPGSSCDDGDATTGNDVYGSDCVCAGELIDCEGTIGGTMLPGSSCDDGDATTGNDVYGSDCVCAGELIDCEGAIGGSALPGTICDDGDPSTVGDVYGFDCICVGQLTDCEGTPGGTATIGTACDDGDASTGNDVYGFDCVCAGELIDCEGSPGGSATIGTTCDDGDATTGNDVYDANCICAGELIDCLGTPGGTATIGTACDDGDPNTVGDVYGSDCECAGTTTYDCPLLMANIGDDCDDGDVNTENDMITADCVCMGAPICEPPTIDATISNSPICSGSPLTLGVTANGTGPLSYAWSGAGSFDPNAITQDVSVTNAATGDYQVTVTNACGAVSSTVSVIVTPAPFATIIYEDTPYCTTGGNANVMHIGTMGGTYSAVPVGMTIDVVSGVIDLNASDAGAYTVSYAIAANGACGEFTTTADVIIQDTTLWYADVDGDGVGSDDGSVVACEQPTGYVAVNGDDCPNDPDKLSPGTCGCGIPDTDTDSDGTEDCIDGCPTDPNKIAPGACGCGAPDTDSDGDGLADCIDSCPTLPGQIGDACDDNNSGTQDDVITADCVCAGDLIDCAGVPDGSAFIDSCGVCVGGNTGEVACIQDCIGDWGGTAFITSDSITTADTIILVGDSAHYSITAPSVPGASYLWSFPSGWATDDSTDYTLSVMVGGPYGTVAVCVEIMLGTCTVDTCVIVTVNGTVGSTELDGGTSIRIYPNPSSGMFTLVPSAEGALEYHVLNALGQEVVPTTRLTRQSTLDLSGLASGSYLLRWHSPSSNGQQTLLIQH